MGIYIQFMVGQESISLKITTQPEPALGVPISPVRRAGDHPWVHLSARLTAVGFMAINSANISILLPCYPLPAECHLRPPLPGQCSLQPCTSPPSPASLHLLVLLRTYMPLCLRTPDAITHPPRGGTTSQSLTLKTSPTWPVKAATAAAHWCLPLRSVLWSWQRILLVAGFPNWACREEDTAVEKLHCYGLDFRAPHSHSFTTGKTSHIRAVSCLHGLLYGRYYYFPPPK